MKPNECNYLTQEERNAKINALFKEIATIYPEYTPVMGQPVLLMERLHRFPDYKIIELYHAYIDHREVRHTGIQNIDSDDIYI